MDAFEKKTLKTSRGYTYTYYTSEGDRSLPTLFFQHGWPDHAEMWKGIAERLIDTKFPIIIPDLLGYDGTDKPTDPAESSRHQVDPGATNEQRADKIQQPTNALGLHSLG